MIELVLAALPVAPQDAPASRDSLLRAAPEGTVLALACEDVRGLLEGLRAGPLGVLWEDAALAPLRAELAEAAAELWRSDLFPGAPRGGELLQGLRAAALFLGELEGGEPSAGGVAVSVRDELARELAGFLAGDTLGAELVTVGGHQLQVLPRDGDWLAVGEWAGGFAVGIGPQRERAVHWAHALVAGLEAEPGGATELGARLRARSASSSALELHVDFGGLMRTAAAEEHAQTRRLIDQLGLLALGWLSATFSASSNGGLDLRVDCDVPAAGLLGSWLSSTRPAPLGLARLAPRDTIEAAFFGLDADGLWRGVQAFVAELELAEGDEDGPTPAELLEQRLDEVEALIGLDLREALFENLTGAFARFVLSDRRAYAHAPGAPLAAVDALLAVGAVVLPQVGAVHVVGLRDGAAMEELIDALIGLSGADALVREEQVGEHWVQWLDLSRLPVDGIRPSWVVLDDALLFSGGLPSLRAALAQLAQDAPPSWLDDGERAARARALVEGGACMVAVADSAALFERRVVRPLREAEAALDTEALGKQLRPWLAGLVPARAGQEPRDPLEEARGWLRQGSAAGERLRDGALRGSWLSTLTWSGGRLSYRSWTEPAQRD